MATEEHQSPEESSRPTGGGATGRPSDQPEPQAGQAGQLAKAVAALAWAVVVWLFRVAVAAQRAVSARWGSWSSSHRDSAGWQGRLARVPGLVVAGVALVTGALVVAILPGGPPEELTVVASYPAFGCGGSVSPSVAMFDESGDQVGSLAAGEGECSFEPATGGGQMTFTMQVPVEEAQRYRAVLINPVFGAREDFGYRSVEDLEDNDWTYE